MTGLLIFFILLTVGFLYTLYGVPWERGAAKGQLMHYVEDKYEQTFTYSKLQYNWMNGQFYYLYATDAEGIVFYVGQTENAVEDGYASEYWGRRMQEWLQQVLTEADLEVDMLR